MEALIIIGVLFLLGTIYFLFFSSQSQTLGYFPYCLKTSQKIIALTFDDGPNPCATEQILRILTKYNVKATFFVVGQNVERNTALTKSIFDAGHIIGNHGYSHHFTAYFARASISSEIIDTQAAVENVTGSRPFLFRPPWLFRYPSLFKTLKENHLTPISGIFGSELEVLQPSAKRIVNRAMRKVRPGAILIFHDGYNAKGGNRSQTVEAISVLIPKILHLGYRFMTVDVLLNISVP